MTRQEVVNLIISQCEGSYLSESTQFGSDIDRWLPIISKISHKTGVVLMPKDLAKKSIGHVADTVMDRLPTTKKAQVTNARAFFIELCTKN